MPGASDPPPRQVRCGTLAGKYRLTRLLGEGGMGAVYEAIHEEIGQRAAVKCLFPEYARQPRFIERFFHEARVCSLVAHSGLVQVTDYGHLADATPYIVMELVVGESLLTRLHRTGAALPVSDALRIGRQIAEVLAVVHAEGIVHRDLKPANVMIAHDPGAEGGERVKVLDFGIAKFRCAPGQPTTAGVTLGTVDYMAPEQCLCAPQLDGHVDVYALGVMLYEMLTGKRPFESDELDAVMRMHIVREPAPPRALRPELRPAVETLVLAMLAKSPRERPTMSAAAEALRALERGAGHTISRPQRWMPAPRRWILALVGILTLGLAYGGLALIRRQRQARARAAAMRRVAPLVQEARRADAEVLALRREAFALFDGGDEVAGEAAWARVLRRTAEAAARHAAADHALEEAMSVVGPAVELNRLLAQVLYEEVLIAERDHRGATLEEALRRLANHDTDGALRRVLDAPARLDVSVSPGAAVGTYQRYQDEGGTWQLSAPLSIGQGAKILPPGSYLLHLHASGRAAVRLPVLLRRGEHRQLTVTLPPESQVPPGYVYIPRGEFLYGSSDEEAVRKNLLAQPQHEVRTGAYLISRTEVTFGEWIRFLRALPPAERARHLPRAENRPGAIALREVPGGGFELSIQPTTQTYRARSGEPIVYPDRQVNRTQDWLRLPVSAISAEDAEVYLAWLRSSGRLPGARLCSEHEWERAARGADERTYPHGDRLAPEDANHDATYGRKPLAFGPDQVGIHPASDSPFGIVDMAGNVWEWTRSPGAPGGLRSRGGCWYHDPPTGRSSNREPGEATLRHILIGLRVCATPPG